LVFSLACLLVALPILPVKIQGIPHFSLTNPGQAFQNLLHLNFKSAPAPPEKNESAQTGKVVSSSIVSGYTVKSEEITSLDNTAQRLLLAIAKNPSDSSLRNQLGLIYEGLGDPERAAKQYQDAVDLARDQLILLGNQQKALRQTRQSPETLSSAIMQSARVSIDLSAAHSALARIYDELGRHDKVVAELELLNRDRAFGTAMVRQPETQRKQTSDQTHTVHRLSPACLQLLARAQALLQAHRVGEAIQLYKQVVAVDPQAAIAHKQLGFAAMAQGNYWLAKGELAQAAQLDPSDATVHMSLGLTYQAISQNELARLELEKSIQLDPKNYHALFQLGKLYTYAGKNQLAANAFEQAIQLNPKSAAAHNNLGSTLSMMGRYQDAISEFDKALALSPDMASSHYGMGIALYNCKDYPAAISELKRALTLNPNYADARSKIEVAYRKMSSGTMGSAALN
jgi:tetratricopeptide (TPR) repeat protein